LPKVFLIGQATGLDEAYAPPTKASKSRPGRDLTDTLFTDIRYSLTFAITGMQKQSEAALLRVRVDGVVRPVSQA